MFLKAALPTAELTLNRTVGRHMCDPFSLCLNLHSLNWEKGIIFGPLIERYLPKLPTTVKNFYAQTQGSALVVIYLSLNCLLFIFRKLPLPRPVLFRVTGADRSFGRDLAFDPVPSFVDVASSRGVVLGLMPSCHVQDKLCTDVLPASDVRCGLIDF